MTASTRFSFEGVASGALFGGLEERVNALDGQVKVMKLQQQPQHQERRRQIGGTAAAAFLALACLTCWHKLLGSGGSAAASTGGGSIGGTSCQPLSATQRRQLGGRHLPQGCLHLRDVCADQQQLVMMSPDFRPDAHHPRPLPTFQPEAKFNFPFHNESNPDAWAAEELSLPPLVFRAASSREPTPDLQQPAFAEGMVPLLLYPTWQENFGHTLGNNVAWLYTHLIKHNASWADKVKILLATPHGLAVPSHWQPLLQPISHHRIESFAEFSARQPHNFLSYRNNESICHHSRCFRDMLVCSGYEQEQSQNVWQAAQHIAKNYTTHLPPPPIQFAASPAGSRATDEPVAVPSQQGLTVGGQLHGTAEEGSGGNATSTVKVLHVLFAKRAGKGIREMSNLEELLQQCRQWNHTVQDTGQVFVAACEAWEFSELLTSIAVAQSADVLIGIHGATMANAFFMKPGSSVVELFTPAWAWDVHRKWLEQDEEAQLQWWALEVEDAAAYSPGALELQMATRPGLYAGRIGRWKMQRDRNMVVPWAGLDAVLQEIAGAWGSMAAYRDAVAAGRQQFVAAGGAVSATREMSFHLLEIPPQQ